MEFSLEFWRRHPALLIGISALIGTACRVAYNPIYLVVFSSLLFPFFWKKKQYTTCFCAFFIALCAFFLAHIRVNYPPCLKESPIEGEGVMHIESFSLVHSPFNRSYLYKGTLKHFKTAEGTLYPAFACHIFHPLKNPPPADRDYLIQGILTKKKEHLFCLKPTKAKEWEKIEGTFSFAKWRYQAKKRISSYIKKQIADSCSATFLSALVTGECDERSLRLDLGRLGLLHIIAISGFHFSFFALLLNGILRFFCSLRIRISLLIASLGCYFFFLGNAPSIMRAFIMICFLLISQWINRSSSSLNALGTALLFEILFNPLVITYLSFQLSFLCTLALLLFTSPTHDFLTFLFKERSDKQLSLMSVGDQHGYLFCSFLRKTLAANLAVHLFSLPVLLYLFHKFPLLSLAYNLFFPLCVLVSLLLFCSALLTGFIIPPLGSLLHSLNSGWTSWILQTTANPPSYFDIVVRCDSVSFGIMAIYLFLFFQIGMLLHVYPRREDMHTTRQMWLHFKNLKNLTKSLYSYSKRD